MSLHDDELIYMIRKHDEKAFFLLEQRYNSFINRWVDNMIRSFRVLQSFRDDAMALAKISFMDSIDSYREEEGVFYAYAKLCVDREILSLLRTCASKQNQLVIFARSLDEVIPGSENLTLEDTIEGTYWNSNPTITYRLAEMAEHYNEALQTVLTSEEYTLWKARLDGLSYDEISVEFGFTHKQIDNSLQRIKAKLLGYLVE